MGYSFAKSQPKNRRSSTEKMAEKSLDGKSVYHLWTIQKSEKTLTCNVLFPHQLAGSDIYRNAKDHIAILGFIQGAGQPRRASRSS